MTYHQARYQRLRLARKCVVCRAKLQPADGTRCAVCREAARIKQQRYDFERRDEQLRRASERYERRGTSGTCAKCGRHVPAIGRRWCQACLLRNRSYDARVKSPLPRWSLEADIREELLALSELVAMRKVG